MFFITGHVVLYMLHIRTLTNIYIYVANNQILADKMHLHVSVPSATIISVLYSNNGKLFYL